MKVFIKSINSSFDINEFFLETLLYQTIKLNIVRPIPGAPCIYMDIRRRSRSSLQPCSLFQECFFPNIKIDGVEGRGDTSHGKRDRPFVTSSHLASLPPSDSFLTAEIFLFPFVGSQINNEVAYLCRSQRRSSHFAFSHFRKK